MPSSKKRKAGALATGHAEEILQHLHNAVELWTRKELGRGEVDDDDKQLEDPNDETEDVDSAQKVKEAMENAIRLVQEGLDLPKVRFTFFSRRYPTHIIIRSINFPLSTPSFSNRSLTLPSANHTWYSAPKVHFPSPPLTRLRCGPVSSWNGTSKCYVPLSNSL
jgi:hypothetical protein